MMPLSWRNVVERDKMFTLVELLVVIAIVAGGVVGWRLGRYEAHRAGPAGDR